VSDKAYQQSCSKTIIAYLSSHGYDHAVSMKQLSSPTTKDFHSMVLFLFKQIEPGFKLVGKMDEEVPQMFKRLRYPFPISKTALVAVGSPHTWPALLAATTWLVELLNYQERAVAAEGEADFEKSGGDREFFEYVSTSYRYFLAGDDESCGAVDEATENKFREKQQTALDDIERIKKVRLVACTAAVLKENSELRILIMFARVIFFWLRPMRSYRLSWTRCETNRHPRLRCSRSGRTFSAISESLRSSLRRCSSTRSRCRRKSQSGRPTWWESGRSLRCWNRSVHTCSCVCKGTYRGYCSSCIYATDVGFTCTGSGGYSEAARGAAS
jgi:hypothetical protein